MCEIKDEREEQNGNEDKVDELVGRVLVIRSIETKGLDERLACELDDGLAHNVNKCKVREVEEARR